MVQKQSLKTATCWIRSPSTNPVSIFHLSAAEAALRAGRKIEILIWKRPPARGPRLRNGVSARSGRADQTSSFSGDPKDAGPANSRHPSQPIRIARDSLGRARRMLRPRSAGHWVPASGFADGWAQKPRVAVTLRTGGGGGGRLCRLLRGDGRHGQRPTGAEALP